MGGCWGGQAVLVLDEQLPHNAYHRAKAFLPAKEPAPVTDVTISEGGRINFTAHSKAGGMVWPRSRAMELPKKQVGLGASHSIDTA